MFIDSKNDGCYEYVLCEFLSTNFKFLDGNARALNEPI